MRHPYPIDRRDTFYAKHVEPVLKFLAMTAMFGFFVLLCLALSGRI